MGTQIKFHKNWTIVKHSNNRIEKKLCRAQVENEGAIITLKQNL